MFDDEKEEERTNKPRSIIESANHGKIKIMWPGDWKFLNSMQWNNQFE